MKFWILICVTSLVHLFFFCTASKHTFGDYSDYGGIRKVYDRTLINDTNKVPKNYTIIYKYLGSQSREVAYLEFDINVESEGSVTSSNFKRKIEAKIQINNALNVTATMQIYRRGIIGIPQFNWYRDVDAMQKSIAFIHKKNADSSTKRPFTQNAIGRRREGDSLLHFESHNVTNSSRFPSRLFEYSYDDYITYVRFSFNSPTAMVMINTSFIGEQEFNAVAYDMNTDHFVANMSVYGIRNPRFRPHEFEGII